VKNIKCHFTKKLSGPPQSYKY